MVTEIGIGERLRNAREAKGLSLHAVEEATRIRAVYLQALEDEQFDRLPGVVYAKGFLRTYAAALGLDPDRLVESYAGVFETPAPSILGEHPAQIPIRPVAPRSPLRRAAAYAGAILLAGIIVIGIIGYLQLREFGEPLPPEVVPPPPSRVPPPAVEPLQPVPKLPEPPPPERNGGDRPAPVQPQPLGGVHVEVRASDTSWLRVVADGERAFQGLVREGDVRTWQAERSLTIRVGNSDAVQVLVNGRVVQPQRGRRVWEETFLAP